MGRWAEGEGDRRAWQESWEPVSSLRDADSRHEARAMERERYDAPKAAARQLGEPRTTLRVRAAREARRERATARLIARISVRHDAARPEGAGTQLVAAQVDADKRKRESAGREQPAVTRQRGRRGGVTLWTGV